MKWENFLILYTKIKSQYVITVDVRMDTIKFLKENTDRTFFDINHSNFFLDPSHKVKKIREK